MTGGFAVPILLFAVTRVEFWLDRRASVGDAAKRVIVAASHGTLAVDPFKGAPQFPAAPVAEDPKLSAFVGSAGQVP